MAGESSTSEPLRIRGVNDLSQGKNTRTLRGVRGEGNGVAQGNARLDQISNIVDALRVGGGEAEGAPVIDAVPEPDDWSDTDSAAPYSDVPNSDDPASQSGLDSFRASVEALGARSNARYSAKMRNAPREQADWPEATLKSISSMMDSMTMSRRGEELPQFLALQDDGYPPPRSRILPIAGGMAGLALLAAAGYGFYILGLKDATHSRSQEISAVAAMDSGRIALDDAGAARRQNPTKDQSRLNKEDMIRQPIAGSVSAPLKAPPAIAASEPDSKTAAADKGQGRSAGIPAKADVKPVANPQITDKSALQPASKIAVEKSPDQAAPGITSSPLVKAIPAKTVVPVAPPETARPQLAKSAAKLDAKPIAKLDAKPEAGSLEVLVASVADGVTALGRAEPAIADAGKDPARDLRIRMTRLAAAAAAQAIPMSDVKLLLETALSGIAPDAVPDVLKNAAGKVDVSVLLSSITAPGAKQP